MDVKNNAFSDFLSELENRRAEEIVEEIKNIAGYDVDKLENWLNSMIDRHRSELVKYRDGDFTNYHTAMQLSVEMMKTTLSNLSHVKAGESDLAFSSAIYHSDLARAIFMLGWLSAKGEAYE